MLCRACRASFLFYLDLFGRICNHEFAFTCKCGCIIATTHNHTNGNTKDRSPYGKMTSQAERCLLTCLFRCNYAMARQELDLTGKLDCDLHKYLPMLMSKYPLRFHTSCTGTYLCPSLSLSVGTTTQNGLCLQKKTVRTVELTTYVWQ